MFTVARERPAATQVSENKMVEDEEHAVATISMDYMYMNEKGKAGKSTEKESEQPIIVIHDRKTKTVLGHVANCKGAGDERVMKRILMDIEDMGYSGTKVIMKSDQEPATVEVQWKVMAGRSSETVSTNIEVGESQPNGEVENAIKRFQEQILTLKDDLEAKTGLVI